MELVTKAKKAKPKSASSKVKAAKLEPEAQKPSTSLASTARIDNDLNYPVAGLNPESFTSALLDADEGHLETWCELCEEMEDRDGQIAGMLATRRAAVIACDQDVLAWRSREAVLHDLDAEAKDIEVADFCRDQIFGMHDWEDREIDLLDANSKGCAFLNKEWRKYSPSKPGRRYYLKALHHVPQRQMTYYGCDADNPRMLTNDSRVDGVPIRRNEWVIHTPRIRSVEPWRNGLMRVLGWYYMFKHFDMGNWLKFLETHAHPLRIGLYAPGSSETAKQAIWYAVKRMGLDQAAMVPANEAGESPIKIQYPEVKDASDSHKLLLDYCDAEIAKTVLGQTLTSSADGKGSYALGQVHDRVRHTYLAQDADMLCATIRRDIIAPLVALNYGSEYLARLPFFSIDYALPEDKEALARAMGILAQQVGHKVSRRWLHKTFGTRAPDGPDDVAEFKPAGGMPGTSAPPDDKDTPPDDAPPEKGDDKDAATKKAKEGDRPNPTPAAMITAIGMDLPAPVATAATEYAAVVDGFNKFAMSNTLDNVTKYLAKRDKAWASGEAFAVEFTEWWERKWWTFYGDEGISKGTLYPFLSKMYSHYKTADLTAFPNGYSYPFTIGSPDQRVIDFMARSDRWYFSKFVDNTSYRGPMQKFLLDEYAERGGKLWGAKNVKIIEGFKKAAVKTTHDLSKYEVERIVRSTVNRARNWARIEQFTEAGIMRGQIVNGASPCPKCAAINGQTFEVADARGWMDNAMSLDDDGFKALLDERTHNLNAAHAAGLSGQAQFEAAGGIIPLHTSCECSAVAYFG